VSVIERVDVRGEYELRAGKGSGPGKLGGYAAVFDQTTDLGWMGKERLARTAFADVLADSATDVRALWNHDMRLLLGRQAAGTLRLSTDTRGLEYEVELPDTTYARDVRALAERGDLDGASFAFLPGEWTYDETSDTRTHTSVARLVDVSPVTIGAYAGASTEARSQASASRRRSQLIRVRHRATRIALGRGADR
jgi:HK97 family phage prohead protease